MAHNTTPTNKPNTTIIDSGVIDLHPEKSRPAAAAAQPSQPEAVATDTNAALSVIRAKLDHLYSDAPDPFASVKRVSEAPAPVSPHQAYMRELQASGRSLADIQTAWHSYYAQLSDEEKHAVWREFYAGAPAAKPVQKPVPVATQAPEPKPTTPALPSPAPATSNPLLPVAPTQPSVKPAPTAQQLRTTIRTHINAGGKLHARHHLQSLGFGLAVGLVTLVITLFSFFNEVIIAPFIQPGRAEGATPIIIDPNALATGNDPEVIIPKINLEIPVDYTQTSDDEDTMINALNNGVVHYPSTVFPGQRGNAAFFGHSSSNILNPGKYKFAFVLLHELQKGDTFYLSYRGKVYVYKVFKRIIVTPDQVDVLDNIGGHVATATLITCDPPGTALNRLVVVGDQISPDPGQNRGGDNTIASNPDITTLPDNGPSLWDRLIGLFTGN